MIKLIKRIEIDSDLIDFNLHLFKYNYIYSINDY